MAFLEVNGITMPVANATARRSVSKKGDRSRSFRGVLRDGRRNIRRAWDIELVFTDHEEGEAFCQLISGHGHLFDMQGPVASTGLTINGQVNMRFSGATWGSAGRGVAHVLSSLSGSSDALGFMKCNPQLGDDFNVVMTVAPQLDVDVTQSSPRQTFQGCPASFRAELGADVHTLCTVVPSRGDQEFTLP